MKGRLFWVFSHLLCFLPQRKWLFFSIFFLALSHCNKICFVCCTESLQQTDFLFVTLSHYKKYFHRISLFWKFFVSMSLFCIFVCAIFLFRIFFCILFVLKCNFYHFMAHFGNMYMFCLSQWLSATNNIVKKQQRLWDMCVTEEIKKSQKRVLFQIALGLWKRVVCFSMLLRFDTEHQKWPSSITNNTN